MANHLTVAVAGGRKTQGIVEHCAKIPLGQRAAVLTFTQSNQLEMRSRLALHTGENLNIEVMGWFTFLLRHIAKPFFPIKFPGQRVNGFDFEGRPHFKAKGINRFMNSSGCVYGCELARLAHELIMESNGAALHRLECLFQEILIDEVQDLTAHDLEVLDVLLASNIDIQMVGDVRQAVISTNPRSKKNEKYDNANIINWFREKEHAGKLTIFESNITWRCHPKIAEFSDSIFGPNWNFKTTESRNNIVTDHDGVFLLKPEHVLEYVYRFQPQCLRYSISSGKAFDLDFMNFKVSKGLTRQRVLIVPTEPIKKFLKNGTLLDASSASSFYVAVTRAAQSVAIVIDTAGSSHIRHWVP